MLVILKEPLLNEYRTQNRGGVGQKASTTRNEDFSRAFICRNQSPIHDVLYSKRKMLLDARL